MRNIIKVKFICPECKEYKEEKRFGGITKEQNRKAESKIWKKGFICCRCFKKVGIWRAEQLLNS